MALFTRQASHWSPAFAGMTPVGIARTVCGALVALILSLALALPVAAAEEILSFTSNTTLNIDGSVDVVETIEVNAEGDEIRRGIYRDIPTQLINDDNSRQRSELRVTEVKRDGRAEPYEVENIGGGFKRIRIGDADVFLNYGVHTYTIRYSMTRMARFFADHDELFWNATGNYWVFPINKVTATLNVPEGAVISDAIGYTGVAGSTEQAVTIERKSDTSVAFRSTRVLQPEEGMSVAVKFQKGIIAPPEGLTGAGNWISDHRELVFPVLAVILVLAYNFAAWNAVGRDPVRGTIIPLFHPPKSMSPALLHYVGNMGFKQTGWTAFTASIFDLGVKGLVHIDKAGKAMSISATNARPAEKLPPGEQGLYDYIKSKGKVTVDKTDGPTLNTKRGELVTAIERENREVYFKNNVLHTLGGVALSILLLGALVLFEVLDPVFLVVAVVVSIVIGIIIGMVFGGGRSIGSRLIPLVWVIIVGINVFGSGLSGLSGFRIDNGLIAAVSIIVIGIVFAFLMRAPTIQGRKLMDQIEGFKMYLDTAEKNRLNYVDKGEPQMTVTRFEAILPFAIALGVEKPWSDRFEGDLARNAIAGATAGSYSPGWYSGSSWSTGGSPGDFSKSFSTMATTMSAAMIAAQPTSSSGSGFSGGGGGGSGGGGGGGGGGGW